MGTLICICCVLCIFLTRDVFLLGSEQPCARQKIALYCALMCAYLLAAARMAHSILDGQGLAWLRSPRIWVLTVLLHLLLWSSAAWLKKRPDGGSWMWIIAMVPAPIFLLSIIAGSRSLSKLFDGRTTFQMAAMLSAGWIVAVLAGVIVLRRAYRGWADWRCVADVAEIASWTGIGILPFTGVIQLAEVLIKYE